MGVTIARSLKQVPLFSQILFSTQVFTQALSNNRHTRPVPFLYYIRSKLLIIRALLKICPLLQNIKAMLLIPRKLALPTGTLKQNF